MARVSLDTGHAALIGRRLPKGGRVRVTLGGWSKVVSVRGRSGHRRVLLRTPKFSRRARTLKLQAVGGGPIEIDAVAPLP